MRKFSVHAYVLLSYSELVTNSRLRYIIHTHDAISNRYARITAASFYSVAQINTAVDV